jgi:ATP-binding cassette subfamily B protein
VILTNGLILTEPIFIKKVFDLLEAGRPSHEILPWILLMFGIAVAAGAVGFATRRTIIWMSHRIEYDLRRDLWAHLLGLPALFFRKTRTGDIMARLTNDLESVRLMLGPGLLHATETVVTFLIAIPMMLYLSPTLTLYSLVPVVIFPVAVNRLGNLIHRHYTGIQETYSDLTSAVQENLRGARVVRAYQQEEFQRNRFGSLSGDYVRRNLKLARLYGLFFPLTMFMASCLSLSAFYFGGIDVINNRIPLGTLVAFFVYLGLLFWPIFAMGGLISLYQRGSASLDRLNEFLFTPQADACESNTVSGNRIQGRIEFRNLSFGYDKEIVLHDINLTVEPGSRVGIVGRTGSGKTTLVALLTRLYPIDDARIFIDGVDINKWDSRVLRSRIGYAPQEVFLFSDTIRENIRMGAANVPSERIQQAVEIAGLTHDLSQFPDGLDTMVGERGLLLSGGQKQRVALARAIVGDPSVLILDDVTSAVDAETDAKIRDGLERELAGRTRLIVSHRLAAVKDADQIVFMERGRIRACGRHNDLMAMDSDYAALFQTQQLAEELEQL